MNYLECPIEGNSLDEYTTRLVATLVALISISAFWLNSIWTVSFLMVDFGVRAFLLRKYSPLRWVAKKIQACLQIPSKPIDAGPKTFAAKIGLGFSVIILACFVAKYTTTAQILLMILSLCAFLESVFSVCIACLVYPLTKKLNHLK
ncbi:MAG: DUF4395 domain-containing protein [Saprospiraceae bacterium]|nr:DUF4395 domain-containing protein [Saprospiraceae bacterium]